MLNTTIPIERLTKLRSQRDQAIAAEVAEKARGLAERERHLINCRKLGRIVASEHLEFEAIERISRVDGVSLLDPRSRSERLGVQFQGQDALYVSIIGKPSLDAIDECSAFVSGVRDVLDEVQAE